MHLHVRSTPWVRPPLRPLLAVLAAATVAAGLAPAQEPLKTLPAPLPPAAAVTPMTLDQCIALAMEKQPAIAAARASLASAEDGRAALANLPFYARCLSRDLPYRQEQACLGVTAATAALWQAEWDARYAVTRNYFSVLYVRLQAGLMDQVVAKMEKGRKKAKQILDAGEPGKVTKIDIDLFDVNIDLLRVRQVETRVGLDKALAALREAIGVGADYPLAIAADVLPAPRSDLERAAIIRAALANRGEVVQAGTASRVTELEVAAQDAKRHSLRVGTFASGADIHAQSIPQGLANGEYRPGAIGLEMPPFLVGKRDDRVARAADLSQRAAAVVDKTHNLIALEADAAYLKWLEARDKLAQLEPIRPRVLKIADQMETRLSEGNASGGEYIQTVGLADQIQAQYNEQLYVHALALAALERITAGGFRVYPPAAHP